MNFRLMLEVSDPFGITESYAANWSAKRKAEEVISLIGKIFKTLNVPDVDPREKRTFRLMYGRCAGEDKQGAARTLESARQIWQEAREHLEYRNQLFHGTLREQDGALCLKTKGMAIPFSVEEFINRRSDAIGTATSLYLATSCAPVAVKYLCAIRDDNSGIEE